MSVYAVLKREVSVKIGDHIREVTTYERLPHKRGDRLREVTALER